MFLHSHGKEHLLERGVYGVGRDLLDEGVEAMWVEGIEDMSRDGVERSSEGNAKGSR